jgi:CheY-like chemotaxis protein
MKKEKKDISLLVVEDEPEMRMLLADYLGEEEGYTVHVAENGRDALDNVLSKHPIDLVLSDINMPVMKGFELLREAKERYPATKRVLITAYNVEDYLELAFKYDVGNIFVKTTPFNFQELSTILYSLLSEDIFGIEKYFDPGGYKQLFKVSQGSSLDARAKEIVGSIPDVARPRNLELVLFELLTNAVYYGVRNESPVNKENWEHDFELPECDALPVTLMYDGDKYGVSVIDNGGRLKKTDVLYWLNRQVRQDRNGMPLGIYDTHGRGFFIAREYIDRMIININRDIRTEVIIINYFSKQYQGYKPLYINEI